MKLPEVFIYVSAVVIVVKSKCSNLELPEETDQGQLSSAINEIIQNVFVEKFYDVNIVRATDDINGAGDLITAILQLNNCGFGVRLDNYRNIQDIKNRKKRNNVIILDNTESFEIFDKNFSPDVFKFHDFYLFVLLNGEIEGIQKIFAKFWDKHISNVNAIFLDKSIVVVKSFLPFEGHSCDDTSSKLIDTFRNGSFEKGVDFAYPKKFENLLNCPITVATFEDPLSVIKKPNSTDVSGFDIELLQELAKTLNFKIKLNFTTGLSPYGVIHENGTVDGALGEVVNKRAGIAIGSLYLLSNRLKVVTNSVVYYSMPEIFVISPAKKFSGFEKLLQPFDVLVWMLVISTLSVATTVILAIKMQFQKVQSFVFGRKVNQPLVNLAIAIFGGSQPRLPGKNFSRFILMMFLILWLVLRNAYLGTMFKFLQSENRHKPVETINELFEQEFDIFVYPGLDFFLQWNEPNAKPASR